MTREELIKKGEELAPEMQKLAEKFEQILAEAAMAYPAAARVPFQVTVIDLLTGHVLSRLADEHKRDVSELFAHFTFSVGNTLGIGVSFTRRG